MKRRLISIIVILFAFNSVSLAGDIVRFRLSKPYCLLNFLNTCNNDYSSSKGLKAFIEEKGLLKDPAFQKIFARYQSIPQDYSYERGQFPANRSRSRHGRTKDLILLAAVHCDNLEQLSERLIGILPNADHIRLINALKEAMPFYDSIIWQPNYEVFKKQFKMMQSYQSRIGDLFSQLNVFYNANWPVEIPFTVTLYPVPVSRSKATAATPHGNALCVGMRIGDKDYDGLAGIVLHEMCHELYNEQPAAVQQQLENFFLNSKSGYSHFAYSYIDEGLATACGNGWANEQFSGKIDKGQWYNDPYINDYGKGLYPLVKQYLNEKKEIDSLFVVKAVAIFKTLFPKAPADYDLLFNTVNLYLEIPDSQRTAASNTLYENFRISSCHTSWPLLDPTSIGLLQNSPSTQVIIINASEAAGLQKINELFPELEKVTRNKGDRQFMADVYDAKGRAVILIKIDEMAGLEKALLMLRKQRYMEKDIPFHKL